MLHARILLLGFFFNLQLVFTPQIVRAQDWGSLQNQLIHFYGYQRAGDKNLDSHNPFYKTTPYPHSQDNYQGNDLSGGWYDAGDFVKFGLPFGYSAYTLLKGYDVFPRSYDDIDSWDYKGVKDGIPDILGEAKIATDFLLKAVISEAIVITDVGNGTIDHHELTESGYANSQRTSPRGATAVTGADVAGLYAASLALMAKVYKPFDSTYAALCLTKARMAYKYGLAHLILSQQQNNGAFYSTTTLEDKMACGAVELYRATGEQLFLTQAQDFQSKVNSHFFVLGYNHVGDISAFELTRLGFDGYQAKWITDVDLTLTRVVKASGASDLIAGAFIRSDWGNAGHAAAAAFSAALAFQITGANAYRDFAIDQIKWVAGIAPFKQSYIVGYGNGPTRPHHRNDVSLSSSTGVHVMGGIVSGPTPSGTFSADKPEASAWTFAINDPNNYKNTEMALDYNAAAVGAVAFIRDYLNPPLGQVRVSESIKAIPDNVDFNLSSTVITFTLESAANWNLVLLGRTSHAKKTFTGKTAVGSVTWIGDAETGSFLPGEIVEIQLADMNIAPYHLSRSKGTLFLSALKKENFRATDILIDHFNDGDSVNALNGKWSIFTDKVASGKSYTNPPGLAAAIGSLGADSTKMLSIRLVGAAGAVNPVVGIKTAFNAAGTAVDLGKATSIVFDIRSSQGSTLWIELEQTEIKDGAFYGLPLVIPNDTWNRIRIPFGSLVQPPFKTETKNFNPGSILSLRFSMQGTATTRFDLDNVYIENLKIGPAGIVKKLRAEKINSILNKIFVVGETGSRSAKGAGPRQTVNANGKILNR